jgi:hypothetical protein
MFWPNTHGTNYQIFQLLEKIPKKKCQKIRVNKKNKGKIQ